MVCHSHITQLFSQVGSRGDRIPGRKDKPGCCAFTEVTSEDHRNDRELSAASSGPVLEHGEFMLYKFL